MTGVIFVRVPADLTVPTNGRVFRLAAGNPMCGDLCPGCGDPFGLEPLVLVVVAVPTDKEKGWTNGAAVAVHEACAGRIRDVNDKEEDA